MSSPASSPNVFTPDTTDISLTQSDFDRVAARIEKMAGIVLETQKQPLVYARLRKRVREMSLNSFSDYLDMLDTGANKKELQEFVNAIATNLTSFFRENHHYEHFRHDILEPLRNKSNTRLRVWSAGCSTGEEPYSAAMTILDVFGTVPADFKILATDIDTAVLNKCRAGTYAQARVSNIPNKLLAHIDQSPANNVVAVSESVRKQVSFRHLNLIDPWPMSGQFDVVFCRNVLIYFSRESKTDLTNRFADILAPGGYLYLGHSEPILNEHPKLINEGQTIYRRREE